MFTEKKVLFLESNAMKLINVVLSRLDLCGSKKMRMSFKTCI